VIVPAVSVTVSEAIAGSSNRCSTCALQGACAAIRWTERAARTRQASAALRGQVVLVNFWATTCTTCVAEMPEITATHEKYKDRGYQTVAVSMAYDPPAFVANFAQTRKLPFGVAIDNTGTIAKSFGDVQLTPTTFLVNKRGEIVKRYVGAPDFEGLHVLVEKLLAEKV
jgi:peroxiredoxin